MPTLNVSVFILNHQFHFILKLNIIQKIIRIVTLLWRWLNIKTKAFNSTMNKIIYILCFFIFVCILIYRYIKLVTSVESDPKAPFSIGVGEGATPFPGLLHFTFDPYLIVLSVKQGGIKYDLLSLWYDLAWDWTTVSWTIGTIYQPLRSGRIWHKVNF